MDSDQRFFRNFVIVYAIVEAVIIACLIGGMVWTR